MNLTTRLKTLLGAALALSVLALRPADAAFPLPGIGASTKYVQYYGSFPDYATDPTAFNAKIAELGQFNVIVIDANIPTVTPRVVAALKAQPNVRFVFCYISIGEDAGVNPVMTGNGTGPVRRIINSTFDGAVVKSGTSNQYASFYVDQAWDPALGLYVSDGIPDVNGEFGSRFVYPNAEWRQVLNEQRIGGSTLYPSRTLTAGLKQIAGARDANALDDRTKNFGFDGFFLDTIDTAGPFTVERSYPWTAAEMRNTVKFIHDTYPSKYVFANRGTFYFNPILVNPTWNVRPYDFNIRPFIHAALFESYYLDSSSNPGISPFFTDNFVQYAPKFTAEAGRPDGFTVFCLDYQQNRGNTLYAQAVVETARTWGWTEYLSPDGSITQVGTYVLNNPPASDTTAPVWDSTGGGFTPQGGADVPHRVGIQTLTQNANAAFADLTWDMARDQTGPVRYNIYVSASPTFATSTKYARVTFFQPNEAWRLDAFNNACSRYTFKDLDPGTYYFRVRAEDGGNREETNTTQLGVVIGGSTLSRTTNPFTTITLDGAETDWTGGGAPAAFPEDANDATGTANRIDWRSVTVGHDANNILLLVKTWQSIQALDAAFTGFLDTDLKRSTGFVGGANDFPVGADYLLQGTNLWRYTGTGTNWSWQLVGGIGFSYSALTAEISIPRSSLGNPPAFGLFFYGDNPSFNPAGTVDLYPGNALAAGGGGGFLSYFVPDAKNAVTSLRVDGNLNEWTTLTSFGLDPVDIPNGTNEKWDLGEALMAHDATKFYLALRNRATAPALTDAGLGIYLDTDNNRTTGYNLDGTGSVGADYYIQGTSIYQYSGPGGTTWGWTLVGTATSARLGANVELSFNRSLIGNPGLLRVRFLTNNGVFTGTGVDRLPSDPARSLVYRTN